MKDRWTYRHMGNTWTVRWKINGYVDRQIEDKWTNRWKINGQTDRQIYRQMERKQL
jgi:hypothetical protein